MHGSGIFFGGRWHRHHGRYFALDLPDQRNPCVRGGDGETPRQDDHPAGEILEGVKPAVIILKRIGRRLDVNGRPVITYGFRFHDRRKQTAPANWPETRRARMGIRA